MRKYLTNHYKESKVLWTPEHSHMIGENKAILAFDVLDVLDEMFWITTPLRFKA